MKLGTLFIVTAITSLAISCTKTDYTKVNIQEIIDLKNKNILTYNIYSQKALADSNDNYFHIIQEVIVAEKIQLDSCKELYLSIIGKQYTEKIIDTNTITVTNIEDNMYKILIDKQLEGYNILPSMISNNKTKKTREFTPILTKLIKINQHNATEIHKLLNRTTNIDTIPTINITTTLN